MEIVEKRGRVADCWSICENLCSSNEDCGKRNSALGVSFRMTLRGLIAQNEYSHSRTVPRKDTPNALFSVPKSSFGEHKILVIFLDKRYKSRYRTSTGESNRSMCENSRDLFWPRDTKAYISPRLESRIGRRAMMHVVIFWPRDTKADIAHRMASRIGRRAMMHVVIFWPRDTNIVASKKSRTFSPRMKCV